MALAGAGVVGFAALVVLAGAPARPEEASASVVAAGELPAVAVLRSEGVATQLDQRRAEQIARDVVANLGNEADAVLRREPDRATAGAAGERLASVWARIDAAGPTVAVPEYDLDRITMTLARNEGQGPPLVVADLEGTVELVNYRGTPPTVQSRGRPDASGRRSSSCLRRPVPDRRLAWAYTAPRSPLPPRSPSRPPRRAPARKRRRRVRTPLPPRRLPLQ